LLKNLCAENYVDGAPCHTMLTMFSRHVSPPHDHTTLSRKLRLAVPNILQEFDGGMESRTTPNQEGEDDEEITMLDTLKPASSTSYKSPAIWTAHSVRIQLTALYSNGDISLIRRPNMVFSDVLET